MRNDQQTLIAGPFEYFVEACELQSHDMHKADHEKLLLQPVSSPPSRVILMFDEQTYLWTESPLK